MDYVKEEWKIIKGYDGRYEVSNCGRIWNTATQKYMKPQLKKSGYYSINLMKPNKKVVTERIHRLVALYFCEKPNGCNVVNHLDSNKTNNIASNLEWTTVSGNTKHCAENNEAFRQLLIKNSKIGAGKRILTLQVIDNEGNTLGVFQGIKEAAKAIGINEKTIRNIKDKKFNSNRYGISINVIAKGVMPCGPSNKEKPYIQ